MNPKAIAQALRDIGVKNSTQDKDLVYVTPHEEALLKMLGGSGRPDPVTGLQHYDNGGEGGDGDSSSGSDAGGPDGTNSENSFDDGSMASSMGQGPDGSWGNSGTDGLNSFDDGSMAASMGSRSDTNSTAQGPNGSYGGVVSTEDGQAVTDSEGNNVGFGAYNDAGGVGANAINAQNPNYNDVTGSVWGSATGLNQGKTNAVDTVYSSGLGANNPGTSFGEWAASHPGANKGIAAALTFVNPTLGAVYSLASKAAEGKTGAATGGAAGLLSGVPGGAAIGSAIGSWFGGLDPNSATASPSAAESGTNQGSGEESSGVIGTGNGPDGGRAHNAETPFATFARPTGGYTRGSSLDSKTRALTGALRNSPGDSSWAEAYLPNSYLEGVRRRYYGA